MTLLMALSRDFVLLAMLLVKCRRKECSMCSQMVISSPLALRLVTPPSLAMFLCLRWFDLLAMQFLHNNSRQLLAAMCREAPLLAPPCLHNQLMLPVAACLQLLIVNAMVLNSLRRMLRVAMVLLPIFGGWLFKPNRHFPQRLP